MKIDKRWIPAFNMVSDFYRMLLLHFEYSIKDISSYEELTEEEKKIIPEDMFNALINKNNN